MDGNGSGTQVNARRWSALLMLATVTVLLVANTHTASATSDEADTPIVKPNSGASIGSTREDEPQKEPQKHEQDETEPIDAATAPLLAPLLILEEPLATQETVGAIEPAPIETFEPPARETQPLGADAGMLSLGSSGDENTQTSVNSDEKKSLFTGAGQFAQVGGALAVVISLLLLFVFITRRLGSMGGGGLGGSNARPAGILQVLGRYPIARGQQLMLLKVDRRVLLLHQSGSAMTTLTEMDDPGDVASIMAMIESHERKSLGGGFRKVMQRAGQTYAALPSGSAAMPGHDRIETIDLTRERESSRLMRPAARGRRVTA